MVAKNVITGLVKPTGWLYLCQGVGNLLLIIGERLATFLTCLIGEVSKGCVTAEAVFPQ